MVLFAVKDCVPLKTFVRELSRYYAPASYRRALFWVVSNKLPIWPRLGREHIAVRVSQLQAFLMDLGLSEASVSALIQDLSSKSS